MDLELVLHRQAIEEASYPHITRKTVEDHLGRVSQVTRIEVTIMGQEFYHVKSQAKGYAHLMQDTLDKMLKHIEQGGMLNMTHWKEIQYITRYY